MIDALTPPTAPATPTPATATGFSAAGTGGDFQTFLTMLTAQLKNQDPLNPMEGTDFAIQLATFAGVEQAALSNTFLQRMAGQSSIAGWIGKEARTTAPVWFGADPITLDIAPDGRADSVQLVARDERGAVVAREEIGPGRGQIDWLGQAADGTKLPDGLYRFSLESRVGEELIADTPVSTFARIVEAQFDAGGGRLVFEGGSSVAADEVTALRDPA